MTVKGKTLYHCHGEDKGKPIHTFASHGKAMAAHRAIMASKYRKAVSAHHKKG